jgi:hypothetical protein
MLPKLPLRNGFIYHPPTSFYHHCHAMDGVTIYSKMDSCFATTAGVVIATFGLEGEFAALVKSSNNQFYTYSGFDKLSVQKSDSIREGSFIGLLALRDAGYELLYFISDKKGKTLSREYQLKYVQQLSMNLDCTEWNHSSYSY